MNTIMNQTQSITSFMIVATERHLGIFLSALDLKRVPPYVNLMHLYTFMFTIDWRK